jgi:Calcineurin-like phosphoesterase
MHSDRVDRLNRRAFLQSGTLVLAAAATTSAPAIEPMAPAFHFAMVTDLHYADKPPAGSRHYRETPGKLKAASKTFTERQPAFLVELGDLIDSADTVPQELAHLTRINRDLSAICPTRHYVLGNHCVHTLTKQEFLDGVERDKSYYSFDSGGVHFVVLDACFRSDGQPYGRKNFEWTDPNIPAAELDWLKNDLQTSDRPTIVFAHQRLDVSNHYGVKNAAAVRQLFEQSGNVQCVFQGHSHQNDYNDINNIHYCTLVAMVEGSGDANNAFSIASISGDGTIRIEGFLKQDSYSLK